MNKIKKTAKKIINFKHEENIAALYMMDPPVKCDDGSSAQFVFVSSAVLKFSGPETLIFKADETGMVLDRCEMEGSQKGEVTHRQVLHGIGYEVIK